MKTQTATFVQEITVIDPDTNAPVKVAIYKHDNSGGMFGIDASFIEQNFDDDETPTLADPFNNESIVELYDDGTSGQDRESYTDEQDRENYTDDDIERMDGYAIFPQEE